MERRTDTGCMLPGRGDNSPLPEVAPDRSVEQRMHDLEQRVAQLEADNELLRTVLNQFLRPAKNSNHAPQHSPAVLPSDNNLPATVNEPKNVPLPQMFVASVKSNARRAHELVHLLCDVIAPATCRRRQKPYTWFHVRIVMLQRSLIDGNTTVTSFSRDMAEVLLGERDTRAWQLKADNLRKQAGYERSDPEYTELPDGDNLKESCRRVEEALASVL